ncbi:hypothetical protein [Streptosporangium sp. CA-115845]|uniref:hypothetical protein n=1 Tax=Streptosporangium sp. CA-115845 TaxID=3240071 RepID=UPI003D8F9335
MPSSDPVDQHLFNSVRKRHQKKIGDLAKHIEEYALYLLNDVQAGQHSLGEQYAQTIENDVAEIRRRMAALDALDEVAPIVADPPAAP